MSADLAPLLSKGYADHFGLEYRRSEIIGKKMFHVERTNSRIIQVQGWIGYGLPVSRRPGGRVTMDAIRPDFDKRYLVVRYSLGDIVAVEDIMDDQYGMLTRWIPGRAGSLAVSYITLQERVAADYFATTGFTATSPAPDSYDGDSLFSTSHPISAYDPNTTWSNRPSVEINLSMAALQAGRANLEQQLAPNGLTIISNKISKLMVNPNIAEIAYQLARGEWTPNTADRNINTLRGTFEVIVNPYFRRSGATGTWNAWVIQGEDHGMEWYEREDVTFDDDKLVEIRSIVYTSHIAFTLGHRTARGMYGSTGE